MTRSLSLLPCTLPCSTRLTPEFACQFGEGQDPWLPLSRPRRQKRGELPSTETALPPALPECHRPRSRALFGRRQSSAAGSRRYFPCLSDGNALRDFRRAARRAIQQRASGKRRQRNHQHRARNPHPAFSGKIEVETRPADDRMRNHLRQRFRADGRDSLPKSSIAAAVRPRSDSGWPVRAPGSG